MWFGCISDIILNIKLKPASEFRYELTTNQHGMEEKGVNVLSGRPCMRRKAIAWLHPVGTGLNWPDEQRWLADDMPHMLFST